MEFFDLTPDNAGSPAAPVNDVLDRNLRALARRAPRTAELIRVAAPRPDVSFVDTPEGVPSASIEERDDTPSGPVFTADDPLGLDAPEAPAKTRWLASRRRPLAEGARLADTVDLDANGAACVLGFGLGYHCRALAERWRDRGVVVCFEPDVGLLRAVLERVDHAEWIERGHFILLTDPEDTPSLTQAVRGVESVVTLGATIAEHPASSGRVGPAGQRFAATFARVLAATRTTVVTTLVQTEVTLRNMLMNLDRYATGRGVDELSGAAAGRPAIVVSAGPSLARNIERLAEPGVRERFVIIATQTTLKPLLRAGVKPHFVTALDYHEISRRFYEGLTPEDVEGVTLVAESKANPAILDAFPGDVRCPADPRLDELLTPALPASPGDLPAGATVAHLAYYLARHLGCDPVILVGQDLGFTDGQYYASGAAIHDVWAAELGPFRTLEQFEWERIVRQRTLLHRRTDVYGRPIYTDEQMATYLQQFEVDFANDETSGRRVIDATEGGVAKRGTVAMTLAEALDAFAGEPVRLPTAAGPLQDPAERLPRLAEHLRRVRTDASKVARLSRDTMKQLERMAADQTDQQKVARLIEKVYAIRDEVRTLEPAYGLVQFLNQTGTLNRYRADRSIELAERDGLGELDRQRRQIERDTKNVEWLALAGDLLADMLDDAVQVLEGRRAKTTRDDAPDTERRADPSAATVRTGDDRRVGVVLAGSLDLGGLGIARDLCEPIAHGRNALQLTLDRVRRSERASAIVVATPHPERARAIAGDAGEGVAFERIDAERTEARIAGVAAARRWSPSSWRGGLGSLSCYDEGVDPRELLGVLERTGLTDAALVGLDRPLVDPGLIDELIEASRGRDEGKRLAICQAAPGLGAMVIDRASVRSLADAAPRAGAMASLGGVLGYIPIAPIADPIGRGVCVAVDPAVRDLDRRLVADTPAGIELIARTVEDLGERADSADAATVARAAAGVAGAGAHRAAGPRHLTLELCTGRLAGGPWGVWVRGGDDVERRPIDLALALRTIEQLAGARPDAVLTLHGAGDPLMHPACLEIVAAARAAGVAGVHVRTDLLRDDLDIESLAACGADVISVDLLAVDARTYASLTGVDAYERTKSRVEALLAARPECVGGVRTPWIVPRITRCDEVYQQIEPFYDGWLMAAGAAMIDPMPGGAAVEGRRIRPLATPGLFAERCAREELTVLCDGTVPAIGAGPGIDLRTTPLDEAWRRVRRTRARGGVSARPLQEVTA